MGGFIANKDSDINEQSASGDATGAGSLQTRKLEVSFRLAFY